MENLASDIRHTFTSIISAPVFFAAVIVTLAVGIGANAAIFAAVKKVVLEPLPYPNAERIVLMKDYPWVPTEIYLALAELGGDVFDTVGAYYPRPVTVSELGQPFQTQGMLATPELLDVFVADLARGRKFNASDAQRDGGSRIIVSSEFWNSHFSTAATDESHVVRINGEPYEIIGVTQPGFEQIGPRADSPSFWIPTRFEPIREDGEASWVIPVARLKEGVPLAQAQAVLDVVMQRFIEVRPQVRDVPRWRNMQLDELGANMVSDVRPALIVLQLAVGVLLLIMCINVANLLKARYDSRRRELAIRSAVGASKRRLVRQLLTESMVVSVIGGLVGFVLMQVMLKGIVAIAPHDVPRIDTLGSDWTIFSFTLGVSLVSGLLFGTLPALMSTGDKLFDALKEAGRAPSRSNRQQLVNQGLVVAEIALTLILLIAAGVLIRSFMTITSQDRGFATENVYVTTLNVAEYRYETVPELSEFYRRVVERVREIPGVEAAGLTNNLPIHRSNSRRDIMVEGETAVRTIEFGVISPGYFDTVSIPVLRGDDFDLRDRRDATRVAIVDEAMASAIWPDEDPVGKRFSFDGDDQLLIVKGVVANSRGGGLKEGPRPGFYVSDQQRIDSFVERIVARRAHLLVHYSLSPQDLPALLRDALRDVDALQPLAEITDLESEIVADISPDRFRANMLGVFAAIALVLAVAGIYGVIAFMVAERTHEIGVRMAMGATRGDIVRMILVWGLRLASIAVAVGLVAAAFSGRLLESFLFGVAAMDPITIGISVGVILSITIAACLVPALQAAALSPVNAMRGDHGVQESA